jgi:hypothetical protein
LGVLTAKPVKFVSVKRQKWRSVQNPRSLTSKLRVRGLD